jgi:hypothetical protein
MSNEYGSVVPYSKASIEEQQNALGILQFISASDTNWYQIISGLLVQGGYVTAAVANANTVVNFNVAYPKKVLGIFVQSVYQPAGAGQENSGMVHPTFTLSSFTLVNDGVQKDFFWWAIGI